MKKAKLILITCAFAGLVACGEQRDKAARLPDLPGQPDAWVTELKLSADSSVRFVGKTKEYVIFSASQVKELKSPTTIRIGDEIGGIKIGAIRCTFHWQDARGAGEQYMWRGRWGCMAGRTAAEIEKAVRPDGSKQFDYVFVAPINLPPES